MARRNGALAALGKYGPAHLENLRRYLKERRLAKEASLAAKQTPVEPADADDPIPDLIQQAQEGEWKS